MVRLQQLPADPQADTPENMDRLVLRSGRMPQADDECVVHVMGYEDPVELGTVLTLLQSVLEKRLAWKQPKQKPAQKQLEKESACYVHHQ